MVQLYFKARYVYLRDRNHEDAKAISKIKSTRALSFMYIQRDILNEFSVLPAIKLLSVSIRADFMPIVAQFHTLKQLELSVVDDRVLDLLPLIDLLELRSLTIRSYTREQVELDFSKFAKLNEIVIDYRIIVNSLKLTLPKTITMLAIRNVNLLWIADALTLTELKILGLSNIMKLFATEYLSLLPSVTDVFLDSETK